MKKGYLSNTEIMFTLILVISTSMIVVSAASAKGIYKCIRANGEVEYTQSPSENCNAQRMKKQGGTADQSAIDKLNADQKSARIAADEQRDKHLRQQDRERREKEMEDYCDSVRENLEQITTSTRVYETDDQGNRTRLTEEQRQQRIQENKDSLAEHCK